MYDYKEIKPRVFEPENQEMFLKIRDNVKRLLKEAGAFRIQEAAMCNSGDSWTMLACIDRLVELGEIRELTDQNVAGQHRVFVEA